MEKTMINKINTKDEMINDILEVLETLRGKSVVLNYGTIYGTDLFTNFDSWADGENNLSLVLYNGNGSEKSFIIHEKDIESWYIDFLPSDNIFINCFNNNWMQIYEE